eukprot:6381638-Pyramimonas_sp.AAC.2
MSSETASTAASKVGSLSSPASAASVSGCWASTAGSGRVRAPSSLSPARPAPSRTHAPNASITCACTLGSAAICAPRRPPHVRHTLRYTKLAQYVGWKKNARIIRRIIRLYDVLYQLPRNITQEKIIPAMNNPDCL